MTLKFIPLTNAVLLLTLATYGQANYCWQWQKKIGNGDINSAKVITADNAAVYSGGEFTDPAISIGDITYDNKGGSDIVVVKRDLKGNIIWVQTIGSTGDDRIGDMTVDDQGAVYVGGSFSDRIQSGATSLPANGGIDIFIAKYSPAGKLEWIKVIGSAGNESLTHLVTDGSVIRLMGSFTGTLTLGQFTLSSATGSSFNALLQSSNATILYARNFNAPAARYQKMDKKGNLYYADVSSYPVTIGSFTIMPTCKGLYGTYDGFFWVAKIDSTGTVLWAKDLSPCNLDPTLQHYRDYVDFYVDVAGNSYLSFISTLWPAQYGPSPGDPCSSTILQISTDGVLVGSGYLLSYGFLNTTGIRRYFLFANGKIVLLKNNTRNQIDYLPDLSQQDVIKNQLISSFTNFSGGYIIDTARHEFYFTDNAHLSKLGSGMYANAGADRKVCASNQSPVILGDDITASCGTPPYTYRWVPATALSNDTISNPAIQLDQINGQQEFILTVQGSNGQKAYDTVVITKGPPLPQPLITASNNELYATSPFNDGYQWYYNDFLLSNEKGNILPIIRDGAYQVKITDTNNCLSVSDTFYAYRITINAGSDTTVCKGISMKLGGMPTASVAAGSLSYQWLPSSNLNDASKANPVAVAEQSVCYKLLVTNSIGNNAVDSVCITILPPPTPLISQQGDVLHSNYATGNKWFFNGQPILNANGENLTIEDEGDYMVQVTDANGCSANSIPYHAIQTELSVAVFPSPALNEMKIQYNLPQANFVSIKIINVSTGSQTILLNNVYENAGNHTIYLPAVKLLKGVNIVRITTEGQNKSYKFIVL